MTVGKWGALGTETTLLDNTAMSAMANNALLLSGPYNNTQGNAGDGALYARLTFTCTMAVGAALNAGFTVWFLKSEDGGTTYERGGTGYTPTGTDVACVFAAPADTTQTVMMKDVILPPGFFKVLIKNNATGQSLKTDTTSAGSKLTLTPYTSNII